MNEQVINRFKFWYWLPCRVAVYLHLILVITPFIIDMHGKTISFVPVTWLVQGYYFFLQKERSFYNGTQLTYPPDLEIGRIVYITTLSIVLMFIALCFLVFAFCALIGNGLYE